VAVAGRGWPSPVAHVASNRGSRARLQAAIGRVNWASTLLTPRSTVCAIGPTVLARPNGSSIFLRRFCEIA